MGLSRTVSEIYGDFRRKSQNFLTPCILRPAEGVPLTMGIGAGLTISSAMCIQCTNVTDGRTPGDSKDRVYTDSVAR